MILLMVKWIVVQQVMEAEKWGILKMGEWVFLLFVCWVGVFEASERYELVASQCLITRIADPIGLTIQLNLVMMVMMSTTHPIHIDLNNPADCSVQYPAYHQKYYIDVGRQRGNGTYALGWRRTLAKIIYEGHREEETVDKVQGGKQLSQNTIETTERETECCVGEAE